MAANTAVVLTAAIAAALLAPAVVAAAVAVEAVEMAAAFAVALAAAAAAPVLEERPLLTVAVRITCSGNCRSAFESSEERQNPQPPPKPQIYIT